MNQILMLLTAVVAVAFNCAAASSIEEAEALVGNEKTLRRGVLKLKTLARSRDLHLATRALVALGKHIREGDEKNFLKLLEPFSQAKKENYVFPRIEGFAEYARFQARRKGVAIALNLLRHARENAPQGLPLVVVNEALGDCSCIPMKHKEALAFYNAALKEGESFFRPVAVKEISQSHTEKPARKKKKDHSHWIRISARIRSKITHLERQLRIDRLGLDFVLYEEARRAQIKSDLKKALSGYNALISKFGKDPNIYAEAARFYRCMCVAQKPDSTIKDLKKFYSANPQGLYRGEALFQMGRITLLEKWDLSTAQDYFRKTVEWCKSVRQEQLALLLTVPEKSKAASTPKGSGREVTERLRLVERPQAPGMLINRVAARAWYVDDLERRARLEWTFILFAENKWEEAKDVFRVLPEVDPLLQERRTKRKFTMLYRFNLCCKYKRLEYEPELFQGIHKKDALAIKYAEFLYLQERMHDAKRMYGDLVSRFRKRRGPALGLALIGLASATNMDRPENESWNDWAKREKASKELYKQAIGAAPKTKVAALAHNIYGWLLGTRQGDFEGARKRIEHMKACRRLWPRSRHALDALECIAVTSLYSGFDAEFEKCSRELLKLDKAKYAKKIETWLKFKKMMEQP